MRLISIDPGPTQSAFVAWDTEKDDFIKDKSGKSIKGLLDNEEFFNNIGYILLTVKPTVVAIEMIQSYGMALGRSSFSTILYSGRLTEGFKQVALMYKLQGGVPSLVNTVIPEIKYYGRPTIKAQVGGKNDAQIRASLRLRYGEAKKGCKLEGVKKDIWAALALATALTERPNLKEW